MLDQCYINLSVHGPSNLQRRPLGCVNGYSSVYYLVCIYLLLSLVVLCISSQTFSAVYVSPPAKQAFKRFPYVASALTLLFQTSKTSILKDHSLDIHEVIPILCPHPITNKQTNKQTNNHQQQHLGGGGGGWQR